MEDRKSNIELLRIFAIFIIILHHFAYHNELFALENSNKYLGIILFSLGKIGVNIFVIITGYFMINKKISLYKIVKLWLQVWFYSVGIASIFLIFKQIKIKEYIRFFFPITYNKYWFFSSYILMYISIPLINKIFTKLEQNRYKKILIVSTLILVVWFSIMYQSAVFSINDILACVLLFSYLYIIGGYIRRFGIKRIDNYSFGNILLFTIFLFVFFEIVLIVGEELSKSINFFKPFLMYYNRQNSIFVILLSILIFYLFKTMKCKDNTLINRISKTTFGIYLIQSHPLFGGQYLYKKLIKSSTFYNDNKLVLFVFCICFVIMFGACVIDWIRIFFIERIVLNTKVKNKIFLLEKIFTRGFNNEEKD